MAGRFLRPKSGYHLNNSAMLAYISGVGVKLPKFWILHAEFDVTIMHWGKTETIPVLVA